MSIKELFIVNCIPVSIGYVKDDITVPLIYKLTPLPFQRTELFTTDYDNQTELTIEIVYGENLIAGYNKYLDSFILDEIPPAPKGVPKIEVTFEFDPQRIFRITAYDKSTGNKKSIIMPEFKINAEEILHPPKVNENEKRVELAHQLIYDAESEIKFARIFLNNSKIDENTKSIIESLILKLEDAINSLNLKSIKLNTIKLHKAILEADYQK